MPALATPTREAPALPPKVLLYRGSMAGESKVDAAAGTMKAVSLMTAELQPRGYQMFVDAKTLTTFQASLGDALKAYLKHSWADRTGEEIGIWSGFKIVGTQLLADFGALEAFMEFSAKSFKTLFELAKKAPAEFGASAVFSYGLVWVRENGSEVLTEATGWRWNSTLGDYELVFEPSAPADALRQLPSVRVIEAFSCDFVDVPAANRGLFSAADLDRQPAALSGKPVDAPASSDSPASTQPASFAMIKQLNAKFGHNPALLARAIHFHAADDKATYEQIVALVEGEQNTTELARLRGVETSHNAFTAALEKAGFKAAGDKSALDLLLAEHASFKAKATEHDASIAALKAAGFEPKDGKTATDLAVAAYKQKVADIATLHAGGTVAVDTGVKPSEGGGSKAGVTGLSRVEAAFAAQRTAPGKN